MFKVDEIDEYLIQIWQPWSEPSDATMHSMLAFSVAGLRLNNVRQNVKQRKINPISARLMYYDEKSVISTAFTTINKNTV